MSETKFTKGPCKVVVAEHNKVQIETADGTHVLVANYFPYHSSSDRSIDDVLEGRAFNGEQRKDAIASNARFLAYMHLWAAAPQMYEALEMLAAHFVWPGEDTNDRFERVARAFYKDTGMLAPGKDVSASANESDEERAERMVAFGRWYDARVLPALSALKAARGEQ